MIVEKYTDQKERLPASGRQIIGYLSDDSIKVYQAFNTNIAEYAVENQHFGGPHYSFTRMSWIKPGFLWMMYRAGWATKENQERILVITLPLKHFNAILSQATISSYNSNLFQTRDEWKTELEKTEVRLQWDPDHDPFGNKQERKAIQLGMKGEILKHFSTEWITAIEDITPFVKEQYMKLLAGNEAELLVPYEEVLELDDYLLVKRIGVVKQSS